MLAARFSRALAPLARNRLGFQNVPNITRAGQMLSSLHSMKDEKTQEPQDKKDKGKEGSQELDAMNCDRMKTLQLDVCKCAEVNKAIETIQKSLKDPSEGLWGLVNNAGVSAFGEVEFTSLETYKEVAEVNLWGTIRTTKASLPMLRRAKGRIVNISSVLGRTASAGRSTYCITKFGMEAFSDCLRWELFPMGVRVSVVEPGNFVVATRIYSPERIQATAQKMWESLPEDVRRDYGKKYFNQRVSNMELHCKSGSVDTKPVIESVSHALTSKTPYTRYHPMDYYWWLRMQIVTHAPGAVSDMIYSQ
ncbi:D-beta-hydroxybutyrate dehydrogenase, mitochondrial isoform X2 [Sminthopsis crassicaudata]|uniref:D-beta-hydroxybutyrate dehydrogenase, mitochondrial isoform X2 n=1 Tax=Sminthopsis crassicaudata TaxID=9301 RepID=UPI003D694279